MEYKVLLRQRIKVYGIEFHVELRQYPDADGAGWYQLMNVYDSCEDVCGIPYRTLKEAAAAFEGAVGRRLSCGMKQYLGLEE